MKKQKRKPKVGKSIFAAVFVNKSWSSDNHAVYLGVKTHRESKQYLISAHTKIQAAWQALQYCETALKAITLSKCNSPEQVFRLLLQELRATNDYASDDYQILLTPHGATALIEPVTKSHTVQTFHMKKPKESKGFSSELILKRSVEDMFLENCFLVVSEWEQDPVTLEDRTVIFTSYVTAAVVADYLSENPSVRLTPELFKSLWTEGNKLQGKLP